MTCCGPGLAQEIHIDDVGTVLVFALKDASGEVCSDSDLGALDATGATDLVVLLKKPDGNLLTKTGVFYLAEGGEDDPAPGSDGRIKYVTVEGDLDVPGQWRAQVRLTLNGGTYSSQVVCFDVHENLDE